MNAALNTFSTSHHIQIQAMCTSSIAYLANLCVYDGPMIPLHRIGLYKMGKGV